MRVMHFYIRNRQVIIPTVARTEEGFFLEDEPVAVIDCGAVDVIRESLTAVLSRDNPVVPTPPRQEEPGSAILEAIGIRRWEAFERDAVFYSVHLRDDATVIQRTGRGADGMWVEEKGQEKVFDAKTPVSEIVDYLISDMMSRPEMSKREPPLPMLLPPPPPEKQ